LPRAEPSRGFGGGGGSNHNLFIIYIGYAKSIFFSH